MKPTSIFDAHCHIFSLRYGLREVKSLLFDILTGEYPFSSSPEKGLVSKSISRTEKLRELLKWLFQLSRSVVATEEQNMKFLQEKASYAFPDMQLQIVPLMMDVFYIFAYEVKEQDTVFRLEKSSPDKRAEVNQEDFQRQWDMLLADFTEHIELAKQKASMLKSNTENEAAILQDVKNLIKEERCVNDFFEQKKTLLKAKPKYDFKYTAGFNYHFENLVALVDKYPSQLYPFLAVDPRRPGIINEVINGGIVSKNGPFYGVKLYPRLGYHPNCAALQPLYAFCVEKDIPVTYHCGMGGFPPGDPNNWAYSNNGKPSNFVPVLDKFKTLRLNFAHMGSSDPSGDWSKEVLDLINNPEYPNLYTDLSCYTNATELKQKKVLWKTNPRLQDKLMFGTDFEFLYFMPEHITIEQYYENFKAVFSQADLQKMMVDNPSQFLSVNA